VPDRATIRRTLTELLEAETDRKFPDLDEATSLREGLGLDSVDVVSLVAQVERRYRVRLSAEELEALTTVGDLLSLLEAKLTTPAPETS
jgi:acyl carrier protein